MSSLRKPFLLRASGASTPKSAHNISQPFSSGSEVHNQFDQDPRQENGTYCCVPKSRNWGNPTALPGPARMKCLGSPGARDPQVSCCWQCQTPVKRRLRLHHAPSPYIYTFITKKILYCPSWTSEVCEVINPTKLWAVCSKSITCWLLLLPVRWKKDEKGIRTKTSELLWRKRAICGPLRLVRLVRLVWLCLLFFVVIHPSPVAFAPGRSRLPGESCKSPGFVDTRSAQNMVELHGTTWNYHVNQESAQKVLSKIKQSSFPPHASNRIRKRCLVRLLRTWHNPELGGTCWAADELVAQFMSLMQKQPLETAWICMGLYGTSKAEHLHSCFMTNLMNLLRETETDMSWCYLGTHLFPEGRTVYIVAHNLAEFEQKCYRTAGVLVCPLGRCHRGSVLPSEPQNFLYIASVVDVHSVHMLRQCTWFAPIVTARRRTTCFQQLT